MLSAKQVLSPETGAVGIDDGSAGKPAPSGSNASGVAIPPPLNSLTICRKVSPQSFTSKMFSISLTNVARHAAAKHVTVNLKADGGWLLLSITDDGIGFDMGTLEDAEGLGVAGMRERAALLGGELDMNASPGKGTTVYFKVPLNTKAGT